MINTNGTFFVNKNNLPHIQMSNITSYQKRHNTELNETQTDIKSFLTSNFLNFQHNNISKKRIYYNKRFKSIKRNLEVVQSEGQIQLPQMRKKTEKKATCNLKYSMQHHLQQLSKSTSQLGQLLNKMNSSQQSIDLNPKQQYSPSQKINLRFKFLDMKLEDDESKQSKRSPYLKSLDKKKNFLGGIIKNRKGSFVAIKTLLNFRKSSITEALFKDRMDNHRQFFKQLHSNLILLRELGFSINLNFHGITQQIYDFLYFNNKLRFRNGEKMFDAFIDHEEYLMNVESAKEFTEKIEASDFYIHMNYFSKSVQEQLQKRMKKWVSNSVERKSQLQEQIISKLHKLKGDKSICIPQKLKQPYQSLKKSVDQITQSYQQLAYVDEIELLKNEMYEKEEIELNILREQYQY